MSSDQIVTTTSAARPAQALVPEPDRPTSRSRWLGLLSFQKYSGIYAFIVVFIVFAVSIPDKFLTQTTWSTLAAEQAVTTILAIGLVIALSAGAFDLSIGAVLGCSAAVTAYLTVNEHWNPFAAAIIAVLFGIAVGIVNALVVVKFRVDSFIGTLGVQAVLAAILLWVTGGQQIVGLPNSFLNIASNRFLGIPLPFYFMVVIALVVWYMMELTPLGRYIEATGGNKDAAKLAGLPVGRLMWISLILCSAIASIGGVILLARISGAGPTLGAEYVLPVFAAAFLGRTQIRPGRFNVLGTIVAVYLLAMITKGLQLVGAEAYVTQLFYGVSLVVAVSLSNVERRQQISRLRRRKAAATESAPAV